MGDTDSGFVGQDPPGGEADHRYRSGRGSAVIACARTALIAVCLVAAYYLLPLDGRPTVGTSAGLACGLLAVLLVFGWEARAITRSAFPRLKAVEGLTATVLLFVVLFGGAYYLLSRSAPESFSEPLTRTDALYFTLSTFSTVGYGDITADSQAGRIFTMVQMVCGLLLFGVAARILAGAVQAGLRRRDYGRSAQPRSEAGPSEPGPDSRR